MAFRLLGPVSWKHPKAVASLPQSKTRTFCPAIPGCGNSEGVRQAVQYTGERRGFRVSRPSLRAAVSLPRNGNREGSRDLIMLILKDIPALFQVRITHGFSLALLASGF